MGINKVQYGNTVLIDLTDTTAVASDVAQGKYFYGKDGVKTLGTATGGGTSAQTQTGTFTGANGLTASISCDFAPDLIYIHGDLSGAPSLRGVVSITIIKDVMACQTSDGTQSAVNEFLYSISHGITGYQTDLTKVHATYSSGVLTIYTVDNTSSCRFTSGITYSYKLVKWTA